MALSCRSAKWNRHPWIWVRWVTSQGRRRKVWIGWQLIRCRTTLWYLTVKRRATLKICGCDRALNYCSTSHPNSTPMIWRAVSHSTNLVGTAIKQPKTGLRIMPSIALRYSLRFLRIPTHIRTLINLSRPQISGQLWRCKTSKNE